VLRFQLLIDSFRRLFFGRTPYPRGVLQGLEMNNCSNVRFASALIAVLCLVASVSGCGSKVPFDFVPVHGKVTYEDGTPIAADSILVTFNPVATTEKGKVVPPGGQTNVNVQDGTFSAVSSHRKDDGVAVGRHKVVVVAFAKGPNGNTVPSAAVPAIYHKESTTPLEVEVESSDQFLDLKVRKK
jgi:predicted small lipoprotein YifL